MSQTATLDDVQDAGAVEHFDVLIVGAGISGVGAAYHLQEQCPDKTFVVLDKFDGFGGTWLWHKYPGIRSDSDLYTFGYRFKPWTSAPIATAEEILKYMGEVIEENDLGRHIRYRHEVASASWSSADNLWTVVVTDVAAGQRRTFTTNFLWMCQGYYKFEEGYTPEWPGMDHPPPDLARGPRLQGQERPGDRLGGHHRHDRPGDGRRLQAHHGAAAVADVLLDRSQRERTGRHAP